MVNSFKQLRDEWIRLHGATTLTQNLHHVFEAAENHIAALEGCIEIERKRTEKLETELAALRQVRRMQAERGTP